MGVKALLRGLWQLLRLRSSCCLQTRCETSSRRKGSAKQKARLRSMKNLPPRASALREPHQLLRNAGYFFRRLRFRTT
jgi:hypothetical protein